MVTRPLSRSVRFFGLYDIILNGRFVAVPALDYREKLKTLPKAEKVFASIVCGATEEIATSRIQPLTALRLAIINTQFDPDFYLVRSTEGSRACRNPYQGVQCNPMPNFHAARVRAPSSIRKGTYRTKTIKHGIQLIIGKLKTTPIKKPKKGTGSRVRDPMVVQAYHFPKTKFTAAQARTWLKKHKVKISAFEAARKGKVTPKKKKATPKRRRRAA